MATQYYDMKIGKENAQGKTFWRTIGTVFCDESCEIYGANEHPAGFAIDYPGAKGIIVKRERKSNSETDGQ